MKRFTTLVIIFLVLCAAALLLMRSCGGDRAAAASPSPSATATAEPSPTPTPAPTPSPTPSSVSVWTTDGVNLRDAPSTDGKIITTVEKNTQLERTGLADNGWSIIDYNGVVCYVDSSFLTETAPTGVTVAPVISVTPCSDTVWTTDGVNLRRGPGTTYAIAVTVDKGTKLDRTGTTDNNWSRVIYQNVGYYVDSTLLTTTAPAEASSAVDAASPSASPSASAPAATSGEFKSHTGATIDLIVRWSTTANSDGSKKLTLNAYLSSCTLHADAYTDDLCFKVGNDTFYVTSQGVKVDSNSATETLLGTCSADVSQSSVSVRVSWRFNGTYSDVKYENLEASATLAL